MSMNRAKNIMRGQGSMASQGNTTSRLGIISGYDPPAYSVKVQFPPDDTETGWIPLESPWVGDGWGMFCPPSMGDQVQVDFQDGGQNAPVCGLRLYDAENVPVAVSSGEFWLVHKSGAFFKLLNAGGGIFSDSNGAFVQLNGDGTITSGGMWTHQGSLTVQQNMTVQGNTAVAAITSNSHDISNSHRHLNSGGSGLGGIPQ